METTPDIQNYAMLSSNHWSQSNDVRTPFDRLEKNVAPLCRFLQRLRGLSPSVVWGSPPVTSGHVRYFLCNAQRDFSRLPITVICLHAAKCKSTVLALSFVFASAARGLTTDMQSS